MTYRHSVTQADIDNGIHQNCDHCPVAIMCTREFGIEISIDGQKIYLGTYDEEYFEVGLNLENWIYRYDNHEDVAPITIEFDDNEMTAEIVL